MHARNRFVRYGLVAAMVLSGLAALGSHSRGGFLAIGAMLAFFWLKSRHKSMTGLVIIMLIPVAIGFMPEKWSERMKSISEYEQDESALGRINSWKMAINLVTDRPLLGGGYAIYTRAVFDTYASESSLIRSAHSIYFQVLGEHGVVGLVLFLALGALAWRDANSVIRDARDKASLAWAADLARMVQVSLVGYAVGGAFLNLAYFDVPYNLLVVLVVARLLVREAAARQLTPSYAGKEAAPLPLPR
jgi:probable O-glycosylation ligase (exosortase A-associated)